MHTSNPPVTRRVNSAAHDDGAVYIGLADGIFLMLALWLCLASLTAPRPPRTTEGQSSVTIKSGAEQPGGKPSRSDGAEVRPVTHVLEGRLLAAGSLSSDGALVVEVPYDIFQTLQQASSVKVISHKQ